jgi:ABC-2 type transport system ATP-binding protein
MGQERYRPVETYSTGMRQKLKFATALVHDPELLILDEPTSGLDPDERTAMLRRIRRLADSSGKSVLLCTHILPDVESVSDFVVILSQGSVRLAEKHLELRKPISPQIVVQVAGDTDRFEKYVTAQGITVQAGQGDRLILHGDVNWLLDRVWHWANHCEVGLARVIPAHNSLQHVFINVIKEDKHAAV